MKKILLFLSFLIFTNSVFASDWQEIAYKTYVDMDTKTRTGLNVSAWVKELNPGDWELKNGKKVWYRIVKYHVQCEKRKMAVSHMTAYDLKANVIDSIDVFARYMEYFDVAPDTVGEEKYYALCFK